MAVPLSQPCHHFIHTLYCLPMFHTSSAFSMLPRLVLCLSVLVMVAFARTIDMTETEEDTTMTMNVIDTSTNMAKSTTEDDKLKPNERKTYNYFYFYKKKERKKKQQRKYEEKSIQLLKRFFFFLLL